MRPAKPRTAEYQTGFSDAMSRAMKGLIEKVGQYQGQELIFELGALTSQWSRLGFEARQDAKQLKAEETPFDGEADGPFQQ